MTRFAICATIKNENMYLREWVDYHFSIGVDKIFLYNNGNDYEENPNIVIQDYINDGKIEVIKNDYYDTRPFQFKQTDAYNDCLEKNKLNFDWIVCIDVDEFISFDTYNTLQELFENTNYNNFDAVIFNMIVYADNTLYYKPELVQKRFPEKLKNEIPFWNITMNQLVRTFIKPFTDIKFFDGNPHIPNMIGHSCCAANGGYFETNYLDSYITATIHPIDHTLYSKHYYFKSFIEFLNRCTSAKITNPDTFNFKINQYKSSVEWTEEHEKVYMQFLKDNNIEAPE